MGLPLQYPALPGRGLLAVPTEPLSHSNDMMNGCIMCFLIYEVLNVICLPFTLATSSALALDCHYKPASRSRRYTQDSNLHLSESFELLGLATLWQTSLKDGSIPR